MNKLIIWRLGKYSEIGFPIGENRKFRLNMLIQTYQYTVGRYERPLLSRFDKNVHGFKCAIENILNG